MKNKSILIHSIVFSPDGVSTAYLYNDIALSFKKSGYKVIVLSTTPHYNVVKEALDRQPLKRKLFGLYSTSEFNGIKVIHIPQKKFKSALLRVIGFAYWHIFSFIIGVFLKRFDVILSPSPPLTIGLINLLIGKIKGSKVIYNVQEIYPDFLFEKGGLKSNFLFKILKWMELYIYRNSDAVTTIDQVFYNNIKDRFNDVNKLHIIPNFVDTDLYKPFSSDKINLDSHLFINNKSLKLMYAGNIGHAQDWIPVIEVCKLIKGKAIEFYVIGEGVEKEYLFEQKRLFSLDNLHILPYQPREKMPQLLSFSDIQFIFMSKEMENQGFPSKVYTILSCKKPLLICSGLNTPIVNFLEPLNCAKIIETPLLKEKIDQIIKFITSVKKSELHVMGNNGFRVIEENYSKERVAHQYVQLANSLLAL